MKSLALKKGLLGLIVACLSTGLLSAQSMSFTVTTKTYNGNYKPKHSFALWISNSKTLTSTASFVKVINIQTANSDGSKYLTSWISNTGSNRTNAISGATLTAHNQAMNGSVMRIPFTWNFKNNSGVLVPDGTYYINIEFSEGTGTSSSRQIIQYPITKGASSYTIVPTPVTANAYFASPSITYTAPAVALTTTQATTFDFAYSRIDRNLQLQYDASSHSNLQLQLINLKGQTVFHTSLKGTGNESTTLPIQNSGIYMIRLTDKEGWSQTRKLML